MATNPFYTKTTGNLNLYGESTYGTEPDMRTEFGNTLDGVYPEVAKHQDGVLRKMRTDSNGDLVACSCVDSVTNEPDRDRFCPICFGEGWLWDEEEVEFYRTLEDSDVDNALKDKLRESGLINHPLVVFYVKYDAEITRNDKLVELNLAASGAAVTPRTRRNIYKIEALWEYRCDNGKLEYYKVFAHHEDVKYLNAPTFDEL